jgi:drug/metabolite transporter (DMT)-like permease
MDDLRRPTGFLFALLGAILVVYAILNPNARAPLDPPTNINLWCGLILLVFGGVLLWLSIPRKS